MKDNRKLIIIAAALVVVLVGSFIAYNAMKDMISNDNLSVTVPETENSETSDSDTQEPDYSAPDFTVYDKDGNAVKLSDMRGKPVIVNFWASWCGPCKSEMPDFDEAYKEYGDEICFMMVNLTDGSSETVESASKFIESQGYSFPVYYDTTMEAAIAYSVYYIPATYFIDVNGNGVAYATSALDREALQEGIDYIYSEN